MHLARVTGAVVSTQKSPSLIGKKLLLVRRVSADGELPLTPLTGDEVAVDSQFGYQILELVSRLKRMRLQTGNRYYS